MWRTGGAIGIALALLATAGAVLLLDPAHAQDCYYDFEEQIARCNDTGSGSDGQEEDDPWWAQASVEVGLGVFGLTASAVGGGYAAIKARRRRRNMRELLDETEQAYSQHKTRPRQGLPKLSKLRRRVRSEHDDGRLSDEQFLELDKRIGERLARLRLLQLDRDLPSIPDELSREIRHVVEDGTVSTQDAEHIAKRCRALDVDPGISDELVETLEAWAEVDEDAREG